MKLLTLYDDSCKHLYAFCEFFFNQIYISTYCDIYNSSFAIFKGLF